MLQGPVQHRHPYRPVLRLVLAVSLDGRLAPPEGGAAHLGGSGDRRALEESLVWADGALLGAETLRLHRSTCLIRDPDLLESRRHAGRSLQPIAIAVSRSCRLAQDMVFFRQPLERWLLQIGPSLPSPGPPAPAGFNRIESHPDWSRGLNHLAAMGLEKLAVLGGARLASALLREDLVDELQLTVCPLLLGGGHSWLPQEVTVASAQQGGWTLVDHRCLGGDELLLHYGRTSGRTLSRTDGPGAPGA